MENRTNLKLFESSYRVNPETVNAVLKQALKNMDKGNRWVKGSWAKAVSTGAWKVYNNLIKGLSLGIPSETKQGTYHTFVERYNALTKEEQQGICFCAEGAIGLAAAQVIPGFDKTENSGRKIVKAAQDALREAIGSWSIYMWNDSAGRTYDDVANAFKKAIRLVNKRATA